MTTKQILVIDDEDDIREVAQLSLEQVGGWQVLTAGSGSEGLAKAEVAQPDAILLDVMMPDLDGPATLQRLQTNSITQHIPVIFLTAKVQSADRHHLHELGVTGIIAKPFDPLNLSHQVAAVLGWSL
ncbi:MAG TPA: response regulator [Candidatus Caenarcaniphilales bacterium]